MAALQGAFRPEFLNRLDEILLFRRLLREDMGKIVDIQLSRLRQLLGERKIQLDLPPPVIDWLADKGYEPVYGARPLKRVIQKQVQNPLATLMLEGRLGNGQTIRGALEAERLVFTVDAPEKA